MAIGWIKLHRQALENGWLRHHERWAFWCYCLLKATHQAIEVKVGLQDVHLEPGQFVFGRLQTSTDLKLTENQVRGFLAYFILNQNLVVESTNKYSVITVLNWHSYQDSPNEDNQQVTNKSPTNNHIQEVKKVKKVKKEPKTLSASDDAAQDAVQESEIVFYLTAKGRKLSGERLETFNQFMEAFKDKRGRAAAADSWLNIKPLTTEILTDILKGAAAYAAKRPGIISNQGTPKMAQGWLTGRRWEDGAGQAKSDLRGGYHQDLYQWFRDVYPEDGGNGLTILNRLRETVTTKDHARQLEVAIHIYAEEVEGRRAGGFPELQWKSPETFIQSWEGYVPDNWLEIWEWQRGRAERERQQTTQAAEAELERLERMGFDTSHAENTLNAGRLHPQRRAADFPCDGSASDIV